MHTSPNNKNVIPKQTYSLRGLGKWPTKPNKVNLRGIQANSIVLETLD